MNRFPCQQLALWCLVYLLVPFTNSAQEVLINCGSPTPYTDIFDRAYFSDQYFEGGALFSSAYSIDRTLDDSLFNTERFGSDFKYTLPLPEGEYVLELWFSENFFSEPNARVFDVIAEDQALLSDFDIFAQAGGSRKALVSQHALSIEDGALNLRFTSTGANSKGEAKVNAIIVRSSGPDTAPVLTIFSPENRQLYRRGTTLRVNAIAGDIETPYLSDAIIWTLDGTPIPGDTRFDLPTDELDFGSHQLRATVSDQAGQTSEAIIDFTLVSDYPPRINLLRPEVNDRFGTTGTIRLTARAEDIDEGDISERIQWHSDIDGEIGTGADLVVQLSEGAHFITAAITDNSGLTQSKTTGILVEQPMSTPFYINCGSAEDRELGGILWQGDRNFSAGRTYATLADVSRTLELDNVYKTERYDVRDFNYTFPVDPGTYTVQLLMAEIWFVVTGIGGTDTGAPAVGSREFTVVLEGDTILQKLDLNALSQSVYPVAEAFIYENVAVADGALNIEFLRISTSNYPKINGIAVCDSPASDCLSDLERPNVQLSQFAGESMGGSSRISWATTRELGNIGFELERSIDGIAYDLIAFFPGFLNSEGNRKYFFTDRGFLGQAYYRVTAQFMDGSEMEFEPILIEDADFLSDRPIVYPNPVGDAVSIFFGPNFTTDTPATAYLFDTSGKLASKLTGTLTQLQTALQDRLIQLPQGIYQLRVETETLTFNQKIVKN